MSDFFSRPTLRGEVVQIEPLERSHLEALNAAAADGALWNAWYTTVPAPDKMAEDIEARLARQTRGVSVPFVIRRLADDCVVGETAYYDIDAEHRRLEIGSTWIARSAQRSAVNTETKLLMLRDCFTRLDCVAVEFRTSWHNRQSRAAIERLGAKLDGVLRNHRILANGTLRDTCVYSVTMTEWPAVEANLLHRLTHPC
jgi:N-acetyltransferase